MDQPELIRVKGKYGRPAVEPLCSEELEAGVSFLMHGVAEIEALGLQGEPASANTILAGVAARLVAAAAADRAQQQLGAADLLPWTSRSLLRAARVLAGLHDGNDSPTVTRLDLLWGTMRGGHRGE
jgi:hypothetical protein